MANNYVQFSFAIPYITDKEAAWVDAYLTDVLAQACSDEERQQFIENGGHCGFDYAFDESGLWIYSEESGVPELVAAFLRQFLKANRPTKYIHFTWAATCSKMRLDEFYGGAVLVTATRAYYQEPFALEGRLLARLTRRQQLTSVDKA